MIVHSLSCPNCGAPLEVKEETNKCFCPNCGTPMLIDDGQVYVNLNVKQHIVHETIDEGKEAEEATKQIKAMIPLLIIVFIVAAIMLIVMMLKEGI